MAPCCPCRTWFHEITNGDFLTKSGGLFTGCQTTRSPTNYNYVIVKVMSSSLDFFKKLIFSMKFQCVVTPPNMFSVDENVGHCSLTTFFQQEQLGLEHHRQFDQALELHTCVQGTCSLGEDHHLVVLDELLHLLHGGAGDGSH